MQYAYISTCKIFSHSQGGSKTRCPNGCKAICNFDIQRIGEYGKYPVEYTPFDPGNCGYNGESDDEICQICGESGWVRNFYNTRFTITKEPIFYQHTEVSNALSDRLPNDIIREVIDLMIQIPSR